MRARAPISRPFRVLADVGGSVGTNSGRLSGQLGPNHGSPRRESGGDTGAAGVASGMPTVVGPGSDGGARSSSPDVRFEPPPAFEVPRRSQAARGSLFPNLAFTHLDGPETRKCDPGCLRRTPNRRKTSRSACAEWHPSHDWAGGRLRGCAHEIRA